MMSSMKKIDHPLAVDEPVGSEGGRSPSALSTGQATPGLATSPPALVSEATCCARPTADASLSSPAGLLDSRSCAPYECWRLSCGMLV